MTSSSEYYSGRRVYVCDKNSFYHSRGKVIIIRKVKKGYLCALDDGTQQVFTQAEIEPFYPEEC